jgi:mono/diheme cytochrome c family protein
MEHGALMQRLFLLTCGLMACGGPARVQAPEGVHHLEGDAWFAWRGAALGVTPEEARTRDSALSEDAPPESLAPDVRQRAAATWKTVCSTCHGTQGKPPERPGQPTPKAWGTMGTGMGFTFGGDKMRAGIYRTIRDGKGETMAAWGDRLAREHIWALVAHIESF